MNEFQFSCLVLVLFCFAVLVAFLLYRCANLQGQIDEMRHDMQRMRMKGWRQMIRYIYQRSTHEPPWAISYETEYVRSIRTLKVYATVYSDEIDNKRHAAYFEVMGKTPFAVAHMMQSFLEDHGVTFDENDFNQIEWEFTRYF